MIEHKFCKNPPLNAGRRSTLQYPGDFPTPNEKRYFAYADWVIRKAADNGIQVLLCAHLLGIQGHSMRGGWPEAMANGPEKCLAYGRYLGKRYKDFDNVIWLIGADRNPGPALEKVDLIALGIREFDKRHLFTAQCEPEHSAVDEFSGGKWLDFNTTYTYEIVHEKLLADYDRTPVMPFMLIESTYEGEHNASDVQVRRQAYWTVLCGGLGHIMGNKPLWLFDSGWQQAMDLPGSVGMMHWGELFRSRASYDLVPDQESRGCNRRVG